MITHSKLLISAFALAMAATGALGQTWQRLNAAAGPTAAGLNLLLTDGSVLVHNPSTTQWWKLKPNILGNYVNGTWTQVASLASNYGPLYYASAVLADGRVVITGGEYNFGQGVWTNKGAWYDPQTNVWTNLPPPAGWPQVGDTQCVVMPDGRFAMARLTDTVMASLNPSTFTWSAMTSIGKNGRFNEEGWTLMPDGTLLTINCSAAPTCQRYIPSTGTWISAGSTPQPLVDAGSLELGPQVLMANGKVVVFGATGHNAVYTPGAQLNDPGSWVSAPDFPSVGGTPLAVADGPACLLPNGKVLVGASPGIFNPATQFFEFDGTNLNPVPATPNSPGNPCYVGNMLLLPNGQVMYTDFSDDVEIYTPSGQPQAAWRPTITNPPSTIIIGQTFVLTGTQFNGLSQGSFYGDDSANSTNYPLVRIRNTANGHVFYCKTANHSTMAVATGALPTSTNVTVPDNAEEGAFTLEVIANGIASNPVNVNVVAFNFPPTSLTKLEGGTPSGGLPQIIASENAYYLIPSVAVSQLGQVATEQVEFTLPTNNFSQLRFAFESKAAARVSALYFIWNWNTNAWVSLGAVTQSTTDKVTNFTVNSPQANYINSDKIVRIALRAVMPYSPGKATFPFNFKVDQVKLR